MYGRRGTGKTHALAYLAQTIEDEGDVAIYIDMRNTGSSGGMYADNSLPLAERSTRLLLDVLGEIHEALLEFMIEQSEELNLSYTGPLLDRLAEAITEVRVVGEIEKRQTALQSREQSTKAGISSSIEASTTGARASVGTETSSAAAESHQSELSITESGKAHYTVHFGSVAQTLGRLAQAMNPRRMWILLDEWSHVPLDLQPYLADLIRRSLLPVRGVTVKIAAIEQRSNFRQFTDSKHYIGIELGADVAADVNLDDFMVFDNDQERAKLFFQELIFRHYQAIENLDLSEGPQQADQLVQQAFTQQNVFVEFVRSAEGVPRDAINILVLSAQRALDTRISMDDIRTSAKNWYQRDKAGAVQANVNAQELLHWIIDEVIGERRARAFLLQSGTRHRLIDHLFDARVLHILKRNISAHDRPGVRFNAYKLDYGCYVDLIHTSRAPKTLFPLDSYEGHSRKRLADVPPDDYRSIRRAILDLKEFERRDQ
jgi:hypothetical protein